MKDFTSQICTTVASSSQWGCCTYPHFPSIQEYPPSAENKLDTLSNSELTTINNKRKRRTAGTADPHTEVVALSPKTLLECNRYICEICKQGFQRDQNLQMHRRSHKVPWKLLKRSSSEIRKRVYVCPESSCLHHNPCHALSDLVGIKKHYRRKHSSERQWKCERCSKGYAVQSDYKAHLKTCGTRGHCCDCGRVFSRVESFIEHQDYCTAAPGNKAVGWSDQASVSSLSGKNGSLTQSGDAVSVATEPIMSTSRVARLSGGRYGPYCLVDQREFQLLSTKQCSHATHSSALASDNSSVNETPCESRSIAAAATSGMQPRYFQCINDDSAPRLQLSIGLHSSPQRKSNDIGNQGLQLCKKEDGTVSQKTLRNRSGFDASMVEAGQRSTEMSTNDRGFVFSSIPSRKSGNKTSSLEFAVMQMNPIGGLNLNNQATNWMPLQWIGATTLEPKTGTKYSGHIGQNESQVFSELVPTVRLNMVIPGTEIAQVSTLQQGGLNILSVLPQKRPELQWETNSHLHLRPAAPHSDDDVPPVECQTTMKASTDFFQPSPNGVPRVISTSTLSMFAATKAEEPAKGGRDKAHNGFATAELLKQQAKEQLTIASAEKIYADQTRKIAQKELELDETRICTCMQKQS